MYHKVSGSFECLRIYLIFFSHNIRKLTFMYAYTKAFFDRSNTFQLFVVRFFFYSFSRHTEKIKKQIFQTTKRKKKKHNWLSSYLFFSRFFFFFCYKYLHIIDIFQTYAILYYFFSLFLSLFTLFIFWSTLHFEINTILLKFLIFYSI